jgi:hypothetical protein
MAYHGNYKQWTDRDLTNAIKAINRAFDGPALPQQSIDALREIKSEIMRECANRCVADYRAQYE